MKIKLFPGKSLQPTDETREIWRDDENRNLWNFIGIPKLMKASLTNRSWSVLEFAEEIELGRK
jgi:hypothetical protein